MIKLFPSLYILLQCDLMSCSVGQEDFCGEISNLNRYPEPCLCLAAHTGTISFSGLSIASTQMECAMCWPGVKKLGKESPLPMGQSP